jgi:hypothetical protein
MTIGSTVGWLGGGVLAVHHIPAAIMFCEDNWNQLVEGLATAAPSL